MSWRALALACAFWVGACTRGDEGATGSAPLLPPSPTAAAVAAPVGSQPTPIRPVLPEPPRGDNVASCLALVDAGQFDVALRPCLLALQADPTNERLIGAVKRIQASVAASMPTHPAAPPRPTVAPGEGAAR